MPIINPRKKEENPAGGNPLPKPEVQSPRKSESTKPKKVLLPVLLAIFTLSGAGGAYYYAINHAALLDSTSNEQVQLDQAQVVQEPIELNSGRPVELDSGQIMQEIDKFAKLGGMISLTEKEIEVNTVTLIEAENVGSSVTLNAVEVILNKKKQELNELRGKAVAALMALYEFSQKDQEQTTKIFKKEIDEARRGEKATRLEQLQTALDAINSVPPILAPQQHFKGMVESRL